MVKIVLKIGLDREDYDELKRALKDERFAHLYGGTESGAGRRAFYLLKLEREGKLTISSRAKKIWE